MTDTNAPPLTVWLGTAMYTFRPGQEITVGRSAQCDICLDAPEVAGWVSRVHAVVRVENGRWTAVDQSRNGIFVDGERITTAVLRDGQTIAVGAPNGPRLRFGLTPQQARPPHRPGPPSQPLPAAGGPPPGRRPSGPPAPRPAPAAAAPPGPAGSSGPQPAAAAPQTAAPQAAAPQTVIARVMTRPDQPAAPGAGERITGAVRRLVPPRLVQPPPGAETIGRLETNAIVVDDALASRVHASLSQTRAGLEIIDNRSSNGTFVNGQRVDRAVLHDDDVVTIGNTDLLVAGGTLTPRPMAPDTAGLQVLGAGLEVDDATLLSDVSFTARPGSLTAVIGPSGAGKSTLIKLVGGAIAPTAGLAVFDGHDVHAEYASMRSRIGMVPQDDVVHPRLTVDQALRYAAELRLPPDTTRADRGEVVDRVLDELELTQHKKKRIDKLSGGQRKRVSVAMELLTGPSLLILDEPTSGLDPALDRQVMSMLRQLADAGRVVLVVTHSLTYLNMCDQVLLLAPGGKTAFAGPPAQVESALGTTDWADIFSRVSTDPDGAHRDYLERHPAVVAQEPSLEETPLGSPPSTSITRQFLTVARRQVRLIGADRGYFLFLALLPIILGVLSLVVPGHAGLGRANTDAAGEPVQILVLLNIAAVFLGTALTIRDLVGERSIFQREQAVGLSASAYLAAKIVVYSCAAAIQTAVVTAIVVAGKRPPAYGGALLGEGTDRAVIELYLALALTAIVSAVIGLALSSLARSTEQVLPMLVGVVMISMVFAGGLVPVTGRGGLDQLSWLLPARWGFAATAATVDLRNAALRAPADDRLWWHEPTWWLLDMAVLAVMVVLWTVFVRWRLRLVAMARAQGAPVARGTRRRTLIGSAVVVLALVALVAVVFARGLPGRSGTAGEDTEDRTVAVDDLDELLPGPAVIEPLLPATALVGEDLIVPVKGENVVPRECTGVATAGASTTYSGIPMTGMAAQRVHDGAEPPWPHQVLQVATAFRSEDAAADFRKRQQKAWERCAGKTVTTTAVDGAVTTVVIGEVAAADGTLTVTNTDPQRPGWVCRRAMTTTENVVIDVAACGDGIAEDAATAIAARIADNVQ